MLVIGIVGIVCALLAVQFKTIKSEYGIFISIAGCIFIFIYSIKGLENIVDLIGQITSLGGIGTEYIKVLLKIVGITFISEISSDIAKDCGYGALSNQIQIFGKMSILVISLPVFSQIISLIGTLLS